VDNGHQFSALTRFGDGIRLVSSRTYIDSGLISMVFPVTADYNAQGGQVTLERIAENDITVKTETLSSETAYLTASVQFPQLVGLADETAENDFNAILKQSAEDALAAGKKNASDMAASIRDGYTGAVGKCETAYDFTVTYNQNGLFSVVLMDYQYAGGAHGTTVQSAYTFDLKPGDVLALEDLMDGTANYAARINETIRQEIDRRVEARELSEFDFSPFSDIGEEPEFYLSNNAVVFYFQEYEYFPYAAGIQEFAVPYYELFDMFASPYSFLGGEVVTLGADETSSLAIGELARVVLDGNPTTGYTWHVTISGGAVVSLGEWYESGGGDGLVGAGGTYTWYYKAVKAGSATLTFKYYRDWEGEASASDDDTIVYQISVS
jgi:inhibitor of cysteine peptidase